jgi:hypothetical protein
MTTALKSIIKCKALGWRKAFTEHVLGMISPKLANMPFMMKKFVRALNMFPSNLLKHITNNHHLAIKI